ncbi:hypothetical protein K0504_16105 [Neiella marina]|uniref:Zinc-regulated TonB-dependent outer membrane receptor n=1 Tax=Neiella holothuriorum TaxID=2870530 RepID=A0ABS7EJP2_9GAMM|nr:hypothetical protein [Neiella holothuriorum]MBW8192564.1 hypothetical protein [Neiella holothuriorum]
MRFIPTMLATAVATSIFSVAVTAQEQDAVQQQDKSLINISAILNAGFTSRDNDFEGIGALPVDGDHAGGPEDGFWLDHTELALSGAVDDMFYGKLTVVLEEHDDSTEVEIEEAFVQTMGMPYGLSVRAGRFLSNVGYLNSKHAHTDSFVDRPIAYRGLLGRHYYDDGVRLNWVAPTDIYVELGAEAFAGGQYPASSGDTVGSQVAYAKFGGDISDSTSWQAGLAWLRTDNDPNECSSHDHDEEEDHDEHEHEVVEFCDFDGDKDFYVADLVFKWAPGGNYKYESLTWQTEWIQADEDGRIAHEEHDEDHDDHEEEGEWEAFDAKNTGWYTSLVYQWSPNWSAGVRYSEIDVDAAYDEHEYKPKAYDAMIQYNHSHFSSLRLQFTRDESIDGEEDDVISLQYTMAIGDHGAHTF